MAFEEIGLIILGAVVIVQQFYIHKSVPLDKVAVLIAQLRPYVRESETKIDDFLLDTAEDMTKRIPSDQPQA